MLKEIPRSCWCKKNKLRTFSEDYFICVACQTLISQKGLSDDSLIVNDDENDFYGKNYWLSHQSEDLANPSIYQRARNDLPERCAHWLTTLLKYKLPPARILELGCAHGGFVALMRMLNYDATGLEISPWVADFARNSFDIPVLLGTIESQNLTPNSFDVIALMDVFEHLPDPKATLQSCITALKPDGFLLIQTPCYPVNLSYEDLEQSNNIFLHMFQPHEHLYLFSEKSIQHFLQGLGMNYFEFEPAVFGHDMFLIASRTPIKSNTIENIENTLNSSPQGRIITAILDARKQITTIQEDSLNRFEQIGRLTEWLKESQANNTIYGSQIEELTVQIKKINSDRTARDTQIEQLRTWLKESEHDRAELLKIINTFSNQIEKFYKHNK